MFEFLDATVIRQIRNAIAHSQYCILNNDIKYLNYSDNPQKNATIMLLKHEQWEDISHGTIVFRNELTRVFNEYFNGYHTHAKITGDKLQLRVTKDDNTIELRRYIK
mgnify:CR=1 FL=1